MEDGVFALFFRPQPGEFDSSKVPAPGNLPSKAKKNANDVYFSIIIPPWSLKWFQAKYKRISLPSPFKVIVIFFI